MTRPSEVQSPVQSQAQRHNCPSYLEPMLAQAAAEPFDSPASSLRDQVGRHRAMAYIEGGNVRLMNRRQRDISDRYPDLQCLARGSGWHDSGWRNRRHAKRQVRFPRTPETRASAHRISYPTLRQDIAGDLYRIRQIFDRFWFDTWIGIALSGAQCTATVAALNCPNVIMSEGVIGEGATTSSTPSSKAMKASWPSESTAAITPAAVPMPGSRSSGRKKCPASSSDISPAIAANYVASSSRSQINGELRHVGQVGSGLTQATGERC